MKKKFKLLLVLIVAAVVGGVAVSQLMDFGGGEDERGPAEVAFIALDPIFAPIYSERQFAGYVLLILHLELADGRAAGEVNDKLTPLRDAFLRDLHLQAALRREDESTIDLPRIKKRFLRIADEFFGPGVVAAILVESAVERRS